MLSIGKLVHGQERYYERSVAQGGDDYYSGRGEAPGEWAGAGARALGLEGRVSGAQLTALLAGDDPRDPRRRLRDALSDSRVAAFDLTFSAPKSVSVLFAVADEQTSVQLVAAHEAAVRAALEYLEDAAVFVRRGKAGRRFEPTDGLVAAAYRHRMSRALDPQLHTHVVAANLAQGPDGRWTALHHPSLYTHAQTAGYLYEAHLRLEVGGRLGLEWGPVRKGIAELETVTPEVREEFSRRRAEMLAAAEDPDSGLSMGTKQQAAATAIATRDRKRYGIETGSWREEVRARAAEHGLDRTTVDVILRAGRRAVEHGLDCEPVDERALGDHLAGERGMTERSNTFTDRDLLRELATAHRQGARASAVREQAARFVGRDDVLATASGALTSAELVACERRLIAVAIGRAGSGTGVVDERTLATKPIALTGEQTAVLRSVARSGNGVDVIEALAGTGKTYLAGALRDVYQRAGYRVLGIAPTGRAVRELTDRAGIAAMTLDRALIELDRHGGFTRGLVVVFDEAGMAATRGSERLLAHAAAAGAKVIAIGDPGQLASVQAGGWLAALSRRLGANRLIQVHRQRDYAERRALAALHGSEPEVYLRWTQNARRLHLHIEEAERRALLDWQAAIAVHGIHDAVLIARDNELRDRLNHRARSHRRDRGELGGDVTYGPVTIATGDRVICRRNDRAADVDNGTRGTVRAAHPDRVVVETDARTIRTLPAAYVAQHVEHAYCLTGHGMQGGTVEHATVLAAPRDLTAGWSYTALSRARGITTLHIDASEIAANAAVERRELAPMERKSQLDRDEVLARVGERMRVRDDEDLAIDQLAAASPGRSNDPEVQRAGPRARLAHPRPRPPTLRPLPRAHLGPRSTASRSLPRRTQPQR